MLSSSISSDSKPLRKLHILMSLTRPLNMLPNLMAQIFQACITLKRLSAFSEEEVDLLDPHFSSSIDSFDR